MEQVAGKDTKNKQEGFRAAMSMDVSMQDTTYRYE